MQNEIDIRKAKSGRPSRRKIEMAIQSALSMIDKDGELVSPDDAVYEMGFEIGNSGVIEDIITIIKGMVDGLEQCRFDSASNDNQSSLPV